MDEIKDQTVDPTPKGQDLQKGDESNSAKPQTITLEKHRKAIEDAIAQYGDKVKREKIDPITQERDTLKSQAGEATTTLEETKRRIADLEADLEEAIGEDADLRDIAKIKKDLRAERDNAKKETKAEKDAIAELRKTLESEREEWAGTVAEAQAFKFDGELARLVDDYDGDVTANFTKLKTACERAGIKTKEGAEAIADLYMVKKAEEPALLDDSGVTTGGGSGIPTTKAGLAAWVSTLPQDEYEKRAPEIKKMIREGKIK